MEPEIHADFNRMAQKAMKEGYKEGAFIASEKISQKLFEEGFQVGFDIAFCVGENRGIKTAIKEKVPRERFPEKVLIPEDNKPFLDFIQDIIDNRISDKDDIIENHRKENEVLIAFLKQFSKCDR